MCRETVQQKGWPLRPARRVSGVTALSARAILRP
jgi:hypothetical protein